MLLSPYSKYTRMTSFTLMIQSYSLAASSQCHGQCTMQMLSYRSCRRNLLSFSQTDMFVYLQTAFDLGKFHQKSAIDRRREVHMMPLRRATQRKRVGTLLDPLSHSKSVCYLLLSYMHRCCLIPLVKWLESQYFATFKTKQDCASNLF